jgi:hypothetical protein
LFYKIIIDRFAIQILNQKPMKKLLICLFFFSFFSSNAQKVDLDRFYFDVSYQVLPKEPVVFEKRTFSSRVKLGGAIQTYVNPTTLNDNIYLYGWKKVDQNGTVDIELNLEDFVEKGASRQTRVEETKDKDGRVTSRKEYYYVVAKYATRGYAKVKGPLTPIPLTDKQIEEEKAKVAAVTTNRFLKNAVIKKDTTASKEGFNISFNGELEYKSKESTDSEAPMKDFYLNKAAIRDKTLRDFTDNSLANFNNNINYTYGFRPKKDNEILWILDAKNEEGKTQSDAIQAVKSLFATMKADEPIDELKSNIQPLIEYFDSLKTKYAEDNKPSRKLRYSAYYNLAVIYLMLDEPEKAIAESEKLIANDYDKSDGKSLIERANKLIVSFNIAKTKTTHNPALN